MGAGPLGKGMEDKRAGVEVQQDGVINS